jgi:hypothetical protein
MGQHNSRSLTATLPSNSPLYCMRNSWFASFPACACCEKNARGSTATPPQLATGIEAHQSDSCPFAEIFESDQGSNHELNHSDCDWGSDQDSAGQRLVPSLVLHRQLSLGIP